MQPLLRRKTFSLAALGLFVVITIGLGFHFNFFGRADTATLYLSPTGSDSNACTQSAPCVSFDRAYQLAAAGDTVQLASGVYNTPFQTAAQDPVTKKPVTLPGEVINWEASKDQATSNVVFQPAPGASVTVAGNIRVFGSHVTFKNMTLADPNNSQNKYDVEAYDYDPNGNPIPPNSTHPNNVGFITFQDMTARNFEISATHDVSILGGSYGPSSACQGDSYAQSTYGSKPQYGGGNNALRPQPEALDPWNILIDGVTIHNIMSYDTAGCHTEGLAIFSGMALPSKDEDGNTPTGPGGVIVRNSKFYGNDVYDILAQSNSGSQPLGPITLQNNWFAASTGEAGTTTTTKYGSWGVELDSISQNVAVDNNSFNFPFLFQDPASTLSNVSIIGNIVQGPVFYITPNGPTGSMCSRSGTIVKYNITASASGQSCTTANSAQVSNNVQVSSTSSLFANPSNDATMNYGLKTGSQALNFVPLSTYPSGTAPTNDINNDSNNVIKYGCRPTSGNIAAGASELNSTGDCGDPDSGSTGTGGGGSGSGGGQTNTAPTASITSPAANGTVNGTTTVTAAASATTSGASITSVQFMVDGKNVGSPDTQAPYTYSWDTTSLANGLHTLAAKVTDSNGLTATPSESVTVSNSTGTGGGSSGCVSNTTDLTNAVANAASGATICVNSGSYGAMTWNGGSSRTSKAVVKPASGATVTFTGTLTINADEVEVQGISMPNQAYVINGPAHDIQMTNVTAGRFEVDSNTTGGVSNLTIKGGSLGPWTQGYPDNRIGSSSSNGVITNSNIVIDGVTFNGFTVSSTSGEHMECLQVWSANGLTVQNSTFTNCSYFDIFVQRAGNLNQPINTTGFPPTPTNVLIQNNFMDCCSYSDNPSPLPYADSIELPDDHGEGTWKNITIRNNSIDGAILLGAWDTSSSQLGNYSNVNIENNIARSLDYAPSTPTSTRAAGLNINYNLWFYGSKIGTKDIASVDPLSLFMQGTTYNDANGNRQVSVPVPASLPIQSPQSFDLKSGAAAIGKADTTASNPVGTAYGKALATDQNYPATDINGNPRPASNGPDIGADEPTGGTTVNPPATPTGLHSTATTQTSISLAWTASSSATGYDVYRNGSKVGQTTGTTYTDSGLTAGTSYSYTLDAYNTGGASAQTSPPVSVTTAAAQQSLNAPTNVKATATGQTSVALTWTASTSSNANTYYVTRSDSQNPAATIATLGNVTSYTDNSVMPNTTYTYYVRAGDGNGNYSPASNTSTVTTLAPPPPPDTIPPSVPTGLTAQAASSVQVNLTWNSSTDTGGSKLAGYHIYRSDKGTQPYATVVAGTSSTMSWGESGLTPNTAYTYTVSAYDGAGNVSAQSAPVTVTTPAASGSVSLGNGKVRKNVDTLAMGSAKAFRAVASGNGSITKVQLYLDGSSRSGLVTVGIYQNSGQHTGKLLSQGSSAQLKAGAWNTITVPQTTLTSKQTYWIAVLNRSSGSLVLRDTVRGLAATSNANPNLTSLPTQWAPGKTYKNSPLSAYGTN